jgi:hypothetical protein
MSRFKYLILSGTLVSIIFAIIALIKLAVLPGLVTTILVVALFVSYIYVLSQLGTELEKNAPRHDGNP